jgi:LPS-assembly lipoprotein
VLLAGCGFKLREAPDFAFDSIAINAAPTSVLGNELRRQLAANGKVAVVGMPVPPPAGAASGPAALPNAQAVFDLLLEQREKVVVGLNATGQVREFQLRMRVQFRLRTPQGRELIPLTELLQTRDISFNEAAVLAKETEEALLYRDMQTDIVQQLLRRLAALKAL